MVPVRMAVAIMAAGLTAEAITAADTPTTAVVRRSRSASGPATTAILGMGMATRLSDYSNYGYGGYPYGYNSYGSGYYNRGYGYNTVVEVQQRLAQNGYYHGVIDGVAGRRTHRPLLAGNRPTACTLTAASTGSYFARWV